MKISLDVSALDKNQVVRICSRFCIRRSHQSRRIDCQQMGPGVGACSWPFRRFSQPVRPQLKNTRKKNSDTAWTEQSVKGSRWPGRRWCGDRKYWSHCMCCRRMAAYASSIAVAGDALRHARLAHNLRRDLVSAEDARGAQRGSQAPLSRHPIENR
jgi:hypothetical protein